MTNRLAIEGALERGHLWAAMRNGRYWRLRWVLNPGDTIRVMEG